MVGQVQGLGKGGNGRLWGHTLTLSGTCAALGNGEHPPAGPHPRDQQKMSPTGLLAPLFQTLLPQSELQPPDNPRAREPGSRGILPAQPSPPLLAAQEQKREVLNGAQNPGLTRGHTRWPSAGRALGGPPRLPAPGQTGPFRGRTVRRRHSQEGERAAGSLSDRRHSLRFAPQTQRAGPVGPDHACKQDRCLATGRGHGDRDAPARSENEAVPPGRGVEVRFRFPRWSHALGPVSRVQPPTTQPAARLGSGRPAGRRRAPAAVGRRAAGRERPALLPSPPRPRPGELGADRAGGEAADAVSPLGPPSPHRAAAAGPARPPGGAPAHLAPADERVGVRVAHEGPQLGQEGRDVAGPRSAGANGKIHGGERRK